MAKQVSTSRITKKREPKTTKRQKRMPRGAGIGQPVKAGKGGGAKSADPGSGGKAPAVRGTGTGSRFL